MRPAARGLPTVAPVTPDRTYGVRTTDLQEPNRLRHHLDHEAPRP
ncbi:hypothetical protein [Kitasatospora sp. NPDC093102]